MNCSCGNKATGTFWFAYHNSLEVVEARVCCDKCATWDTGFFTPQRPNGFIPNFFSSDIQEVGNKLIRLKQKHNKGRFYDR